MFENIANNPTVNKFISTDNFEKLARAVIIFVVGYIVLRIFALVVKRIMGRYSGKQSCMVANKIIKYGGMAILLIVVLSELGVNLAALIGAAGVLGLALGVASQKSLGNIVSGIFLLAEKPFEVGDVIKVNNISGIVHDVELLSLKMRTFDNQMIRIPNEILMSTPVTNITRFPLRRMDFDFQISYGDDIRKAEEICRAIAAANPLVLDEPAPLFVLKEFADSGLGILLGVWFMKEDYMAVKNSVFLGISDKLEEAGLTIPFPQITLHNAQESSEAPMVDKR